MMAKSDEYRNGYQNSIMQVQRQCNLRSKNVGSSAANKNIAGSNQKKDAPSSNNQKKDDSSKENPDKKDLAPKETYEMHNLFYF